MKEYILDGSKIYDLNSFLREFAKVVNAPNGYFGKDLLQFDDCLFGNFGLETPCKIIWRNYNISKKLLTSEMLQEYYEIQKQIWEECVTNEIQEYKHAGAEIDGTLFSQDMVNMCDDKIEKSIKENLDMFQEIVDIIQSVPERSPKGNTVCIYLILE